MLAELAAKTMFEQSYFSLLFVQRRQQMPSDKSRFTIPNRARDDDDAAVVRQRVGYFLRHGCVACVARSGGWRKLAEVGEGLRGVIISCSASRQAQLWPESEVKAEPA